MGFSRKGLTNGGKTKHYQFEFDTALSAADGVDRTNALIDSCEGDFALMESWFPGVTPFSPHMTVQVQNASGGASWGGIDGNVKLMPGSGTSVNVLRYLLVSEVTEMFMSALGNGWFDTFDEGSKGESLSRFLGVQFQIAASIGPKPPSGFGVTTLWLNDGVRADFIDSAPDDNNPDPTTGCGTLFLFFLHDQLGFSINQIIAAGSSTLAGVFGKLTGRRLAFTEFSGLLNSHYPIGSVFTPTGESVFPVVDIQSIPTLNQLTVGFGDVGTVVFTGPAMADFSIALTSDDPTLVQVPTSITATVGATKATFAIQTSAQMLGSVKTVLVHASYAGRTLTLPVQVGPPRLSSLTVSPGSVVCGSTAIGIVTLNRPPLGGHIDVQLLSVSPGFAQVDKKVTVFQNHVSGNFPIRTTATTVPFAPAKVDIEASFAGTFADGVLIVEPQVVVGILRALTLVPNTVTGGTTCHGMVELESAVGTDTRIGLAAVEPGSGGLPKPGSQSSVASVDDHLIIPAGGTTATFTITTKVVSATVKKTAVIMAAAVVQKSATLTITS